MVTHVFVDSEESEEEQKKVHQPDALQDIFVDVDNSDAGVGDPEYSDEEEAKFHAQYQEKHFM